MANLPQNANYGNLVTVFNGEINNNHEMLCNARDLHKFLGVGRDFSSWIKDRIKEYGFIKNQDFVTVQNLSSPKRGSSKARQQVMIDYHITLDMAKELAMVEKNAKGREIRRYFIQCEKQMSNQSVSLLEQYFKAEAEFEKLADMASNAGRTLNLVGKRFKPQAKQKVVELTLKIQPMLPFAEFLENGHA